VTERRPDIPAELKRAVLMEAGYACAIPACRHTTTELAHIVPWAQVQEHRFDNLIALCPNHHAQYDDKREIDRKAMLQYKANLALLNGRYSDLERRVLQAMADANATPGHGVRLPGGMDILMMHLVQDGIVEPRATGGVYISGVPAHVAYVLTDKGRAFIDRWLGADPLL
jgi:HNH endonuclease